MKQVIRIIIGIFMPFVLIVSGGAMFDWGLDNDRDYVVWVGIGLVVVGIVWGLVLWLWVNLRTW